MENVPVGSGRENGAAIVFYYIFKMAPYPIAAGAIYLGYRLFILGVTGQASLSIDSKTVSGQLLNAAPGLFFTVGGIVALIVTVWKGVSVSFGENNGPSSKYWDAQFALRLPSDPESPKPPDSPHNL
jgi:hypothetical protein